MQRCTHYHCKTVSSVSCSIMFHSTVQKSSKTLAGGRVMPSSFHTLTLSRSICQPFFPCSSPPSFSFPFLFLLHWCYSHCCPLFYLQRPNGALLISLSCIIKMDMQSPKELSSKKQIYYHRDEPSSLSTFSFCLPLLLFPVSALSRFFLFYFFPYSVQFHPV